MNSQSLKLSNQNKMFHQFSPSDRKKNNNVPHFQECSYPATKAIVNIILPDTEDLPHLDAAMKDFPDDVDFFLGTIADSLVIHASKMDKGVDEEHHATGNADSFSTSLTSITTSANDLSYLDMLEAILLSESFKARDSFSLNQHRVHSINDEHRSSIYSKSSKKLKQVGDKTSCRSCKRRGHSDSGNL